MSWHEDFYIWGEIEKIRAMKFGADAEIHRDTQLQQMAARIGKPNAGCLLTHAAVDAYLVNQRNEHGDCAIRIAIKYFRSGWFWDDDGQRVDLLSFELKGWEVGKLKALLRNYNRKELSEKRSEAGKKGMANRWGNQVETPDL